MFDEMKCIKTGCDVTIENACFHGDLMYWNGILVLAGVPKEPIYEIKLRNYHFRVNTLVEIPSQGNHYRSFIVSGISEVSEQLLQQFKEYEKSEVIELFSEDN